MMAMPVWRSVMQYFYFSRIAIAHS